MTNSDLSVLMEFLAGGVGVGVLLLGADVVSEWLGRR